MIHTVFSKAPKSKINAVAGLELRSLRSLGVVTWAQSDIVEPKSFLAPGDLFSLTIKTDVEGFSPRLELFLA